MARGPNVPRHIVAANDIEDNIYTTSFTTDGDEIFIVKVNGSRRAKRGRKCRGSVGIDGRIDVETHRVAQLSRGGTDAAGSTVNKEVASFGDRLIEKYVTPDSKKVSGRPAAST